LFTEERQRLLEDVTERRYLSAGIRRERRRAAEKQNREGDEDGAGPSSAPMGGE
jgi:hypothetical protein